MESSFKFLYAWEVLACMSKQITYLALSDMTSYHKYVTINQYEDSRLKNTLKTFQENGYAIYDKFPCKQHKKSSTTLPQECYES